MIIMSDLEQYTSSIISSLPGMAYRCLFDKNGTMKFLSKQCKEITGFETSDIVDNKKIAYNDLILPEDHLKIWKNVQDSVQNKDFFENVYRIKTKNNEIKWIWDRGKGIFNSQGELLFLEGFIEDITQMKKIEDELRRSEGRNSILLEKIPATVWTVDKDLVYTSSTGSGLSLLGLKNDEVKGVSLYDFLDTDDPDHIVISSHLKALKGHSVSYVFEFNGVHWKTHMEPLPDMEGSIVGVIGVAHDITDIKTSEKLLRISEEKYRSIFENAMEGIFQNTLEGKFISVNPALVSIFDYDSPEVMIKSVSDISELYANPEERLKIIESLKQYGKLNNYEVQLKRKDGELIWVIIHVSPIYNKKGELIYLEGIMADITDRKRAENLLIESEEKYRTLFESDPDYTILMDLNGYLLDVNPAALDITGLNREELVGKHFSRLNIFPEDVKKYNIEHFTNLIYEDKKISFISRIYDYKGDICWIEVKKTIVKKNDQINYILLICSDITERKRDEDRIKASLKEKELLLKEIHHRVKNNMQIISSLISLQKQYVDEVTYNVLTDSQNRINSMAMIHEKLYQPTNLNRINISDYIKNLVYDLSITLASPWNIVKPTFDIDDISLNIETAAPCGLIINELVSNSIKYAFPPETEGKIYMSLKKSNQGCELIISDNGIGIPEDIDYKNTKSLGLQLVNNLVSQLNGEIKLERKEGTTFKITFKELKYKERF